MIGCALSAVYRIVLVHFLWYLFRFPILVPRRSCLCFPPFRLQFSFLDTPFPTANSQRNNTLKPVKGICWLLKEFSGWPLCLESRTYEGPYAKVHWIGDLSTLCAIFMDNTTVPLPSQSVATSSTRHTTEWKRTFLPLARTVWRMQVFCMTCTARSC